LLKIDQEYDIDLRRYSGQTVSSIMSILVTKNQIDPGSISGDYWFYIRYQMEITDTRLSKNKMAKPMDGEEYLVSMNQFCVKHNPITKCQISQPDHDEESHLPIAIEITKFTHTGPGDDNLCSYGGMAIYNFYKLTGIQLMDYAMSVCQEDQVLLNQPINLRKGDVISALSYYDALDVAFLVQRAECLSPEAFLRYGMIHINEIYCTQVILDLSSEDHMWISIEHPSVKISVSLKNNKVVGYCEDRIKYTIVVNRQSKRKVQDTIESVVNAKRLTIGLQKRGDCYSTTKLIFKASTYCGQTANISSAFGFVGERHCPAFNISLSAGAGSTWLHIPHKNKHFKTLAKKIIEFLPHPYPMESKPVTVKKGILFYKKSSKAGALRMHLTLLATVEKKLRTRTAKHVSFVDKSSQFFIPDSFEKPHLTTKMDLWPQNLQPWQIVVSDIIEDNLRAFHKALEIPPQRRSSMTRFAFNGAIYYLYKGASYSWDLARACCERKGKRLVSLSSSQDLEAMKSFFGFVYRDRYTYDDNVCDNCFTARIFVGLEQVHVHYCCH